MKFKMAAAVILNLLFLSILVKWSIFGPAGYITAKFHSSMSIGGRDIAVCEKKSKMATAAILNLICV